MPLGERSSFLFILRQTVNRPTEETLFEEALIFLKQEAQEAPF